MLLVYIKGNFIQMRNVILLIAFLLLSCKADDSGDLDFVCTVDYVEFTSNNRSIVKFDVELEGVKDSYFVEQAYIQEDSDFFIGDKLVNIKSFTAKGNQATFTFEYGENLGPFCVELFSAIPEHTHNTFEAEAEKVLSDKGTGRWKIKKRN